MKLVGRDAIIREIQRYIELGGQRTVGFYGVGGIGKTSVLKAATEDVAEFTPYVVRLDFTPRSATSAATEAETMLHIIHQLEDTGKTSSRRLIGKAASPFEPCLEALGLTPDRKRGLVFQINTVIAKQGSTVQDAQQGNSFQPTKASIPAATHALNQALANLPVKYEVRHSTALTRPLVVFVLDTLERAPRAVIDWLLGQVDGRWQELVLLLAAGRDSIEKFLTREMPRLEDPSARELLAAYAIYTPSVANQLNALCRGIPQCLHIAGQTMQDFPDTNPATLIQEKVPDALLQGYLIHDYLERMRATFERDGQTINLREKQLYYLLTCGAILEQWDEPALRAILTGLEHVGGVFNTDAEFDLILAEAQKRSFLSDRQLHPTLRELALRRLRQNEPLWKSLHQRAMAYFEGRGDTLTALTYQSELDPTATWEQITTHYTENPVGYFVIVRRLPSNPAYADLVALVQLEAVMAINPRDGEAPALQLYEKWLPEHPLFARLTPCIDRLRENGTREFQLQVQRIEAHRTQDTPAEAKALFELGELKLSAYRGAEAESYYDQALNLFRQLNDPQGVANALMGLGEVKRYQGRYEEAAGDYGAALAESKAIGDRVGAANALVGLGEVKRLQGRNEEAAGDYGAALAESKAIGDRVGAANALVGLGEVKRLQGRNEEAAGDYGAALGEYKAIGDRLGAANALRSLAWCSLDQNDCTQAAEWVHAFAALLDEPASREIAANFTQSRMALQAELLKKCGEV